MIERNKVIHANDIAIKLEQLQRRQLSNGIYSRCWKELPYKRSSPPFHHMPHSHMYACISLRYKF